MKQILLDTDIGSDIDDAVCLAYLLKQKACDLLGITTVSGGPHERACLASAICHEAGRPDIPIHCGAANPLVVSQNQADVPQYKYIGDWSHQKDFPDNTAIDFLSETIREHPGKVTLLTIGPLTNIAQLFQADPEIPGLLKEWIAMGGWYYHDLAPDNPRRPEWNIFLDPHAAHRVFHAPVENKRVVGMDVTGQCIMEKEEVKKAFTSPVLKPVYDFSAAWFEEKPHITFHDPLAAALIFQPDLCKWEKGDVNVEWKSEEQLGYTHFKPASSGDIQVAKTVDPQRFFNHFFEVVNA